MLHPGDSEAQKGESKPIRAGGGRRQQGVNFAYSAALRQVGGDEHLAQDVAQTVFSDLDDLEFTKDGAVDLEGNKVILSLRVPLQRPGKSSVIVLGGITDGGVTHAALRQDGLLWRTWRAIRSQWPLLTTRAQAWQALPA